MNRSHLFYLLGYSLLAFLLGFSTFQKNDSSDHDDGSQATASEPPKEAEKKQLLPFIHSTDSIESLVEIKDPRLRFNRLALWLLDADEAAIADYWNRIKDDKSIDAEAKQLLFVHWSLRNTQAPFDATRGTADTKYAWIGWTNASPQDALQAVIAKDDHSMLKVVCTRLGHFHHDWLMAHFDEIPESVKYVAIHGLTSWTPRKNPKEILDFLLSIHKPVDTRMFANLCSQDPHEALAWFNEHQELFSKNDDLTNSLKTLANNASAEDLEKMIAQSTSGIQRWTLEKKLFELTLAENPEQALADAENTETNRVAQEKFSLCGLKALENNPEQAFSIAEKMVQKNADVFDVNRQSLGELIHYYKPSSIESISTFFYQLLMKNPERTMDLFHDDFKTNSPNFTLTYLIKNWAADDPVAFEKWLDHRTNPDLVKYGVERIISNYTDTVKFQEAVPWILRKEASDDSRKWFYSSWHEINPQQAEQWLEQSPLMESQKVEIKQFAH